MRGYASRLSGITFSKAKLADKLAESAKQEHNAIYHLYDMGYLPAPVMPDLSDVLFSLFEEEPDLRSIFWTRTGACDLSALRFEYASAMYEGGTAQLHNALGYVAQAVQARAVMDDIRGLIDCIRFPRRTDSISLRVTPSVSKGIVSYYKKPFLMTGNLADCVGASDKAVLVVDMDIYRLSALRKAGYNQISGGGDEIDLKFMRLFLTGEVIGRGIDGVRLYQDVMKSIGNNENCITKLIDSTIDLCGRRLDFLRPGRCIYITDRYAVFETNNRYLPPRLPFRDYEMGSFARGISPCMQLLGFGGEFVPSGDLPFGIENKKVFQTEITSELILPKYLVSGAETDITDGMDVYMDEADVCHILKVPSLDKIRFEILNSVGDSNIWYRLVGELFQCYAYAICDKLRPGRKSSRHVQLSSEFSEVTQTDFVNACQTVERMLNSTGLIGIL